MSFSFSSSPGNLFNAFGKLALVLKQMRTNQSSQNTNLTDITNGVVGQFTVESDIQALVGNAYIGQLNAMGGVGSLMQSVAEAALNRIVFNDSPRPNQSLTTYNTSASLSEVIRQMKLQGATVLAQSITSVINQFNTFGANTGNGVVNVSVIRPLDGRTLENSFSETVLLTCTSDSYIGGATAGNEGFSVNGEGVQTDPFAFNWPLGSGGSVGLSAINGNTDNGAGNLLTNSGFTDFTSNVPDNWTLVAGAGGTNLAQENTIVYDNTGSALRIIGDGTTNMNLTQTFNSSSFTSGTLDELTQYSFNIFARRDGTAAAAGVLTIDLIDGSNNVINDANGVANSFTIDLTALSTSYASFRGVFRTPAVLPTTQKIRMRLTTALTSGRSVYVDRASLGGMTQLAVGCPFFAVHSGSSNFVSNDIANVAITNSRGAAGVLDTFQCAFWRLLPVFATGEYLLPSSSTPSLSDSTLIA